MKIEFTKDCKANKKGLIVDLDPAVCSILIKNKVAKKYSKKAPPKKNE